ncbi:ADP-ribose pyrophosphatase [Micrococcales bacterium KH10]|nr:ADP-ribose pyrophosphatase [Micrococcales bacterium KH10]
MSDETESSLRDRIAPREVQRREVLHQGAIWNLVRDEVDLGAAGVVSREILDHPGAVGIVALDERERVLVLKQYRHPVRRELWEVPAGLMDHEHENPLATAQRELFEEADLRAESWHVLADFYTSPGGTTEPLRVYLAQGLTPVAETERYERHEEELDMEFRWVGLDELVAAVLRGDLHNPTLVVGTLAAFAARADGWSSLRDADSPWLEQITRRLIADAT